MSLTEDIINAFNLKGDAVPLIGGQNSSIKINDAVLKPVEEVQYNEWLLNIIDNIYPEGYRVSKPIKNKNGTYVYNGWICTRFEPGADIPSNVEDKLRVSRLFHHDLSNVNYGTPPKTDDPWYKAHRIAWKVDDLPNGISRQSHEILEDLLGKVSRTAYDKVQIIHADLSSNILFDHALSPLVIDFSPTIAPVEYAEAILVCDCIAWQGSTISELHLLHCNRNYKEMIMRAILFRLSTRAILAGENYDEFVDEYNAFMPILDYIN